MLTDFILQSSSFKAGVPGWLAGLRGLRNCLVARKSHRRYEEVLCALDPAI
jgi:hypothetical protein